MGSSFAVLLGVNTLILAIRYVYILFYPIDLAPDEALYWEYSRRPDISYYSKPPFVGYLIFISTSLFGNTELGVRFFPPLLAFLLSFVAYRFSLDLGFRREVALVSAILPHFLIGPSINAILMTIDAPFIFFYSLSLWLLWKALNSTELRWWYLGGISSAFAFLSKYTAVFLFPTLLIFKPSLLKDRRFWILISFFSLSVLPVVLWNVENDFVGFKHLFFLAGAKDKERSLLTLKYLPEFIGGQIAILSILPFFFMIYGWWKALRSRDRGELYLTYAVLPVFLFFLLLSLNTRVYANWSAFPYMAGIILAVKHMGKIWISISFLVGSLTLLPLYLPLLPPKIDMKKRIVGWEELGGEVSKIFDDKYDFIITPSYQLSAELAFYVRGNPITYSVNLGRRMNDYDLWKEDLPNKKGKNGIFVTYGDLRPEIRGAFEDVVYRGVFVYRYRGTVIRRLNIYKLSKFRGEIEEKPFERF